MFSWRRKRADDRTRDDRLPSHDDVSDDLAGATSDTTPVNETDLDRHLELVAFRPPLGATVLRVAPALLIVGMLLCIPFSIGTDAGRAITIERGVLGLAGTWLGMIAIIVLAAILGISISRSVSNELRRSRRVDTFRIAIGESAFAAAAATMAGAIIVTIDMLDAVAVIGVVFVMTFLFTWAMLFPLYRKAWDDAAGSGDEV
ncbi:MAG: hypothetical protein ACTH31_14425 [Pseudoclavibacter sp.]